jgi:hypothetical protein
MAPKLILLMSSGSKKKEPRYACLSEAKVSNSQGMWAEVSSSAPHLLHNGLSDSPVRWWCLHKVLRPISRPETALDCVLLKDRNVALAPRQGPRACLWVLPRPRHHAHCWLTKQHLILLLMSYLETPKAGSGPTNFRAEPSLESSSAISLPCTPACPGTQNSPRACWVEISFNACWHSWNNWKVEVAVCYEVASSPSLLPLGHILLPFVMRSMLALQYFYETLILKIKLFYFENLKHNEMSSI